MMIFYEPFVLQENNGYDTVVGELKNKFKDEAAK
jgi:hypothetical protein